MLYIPLPTVNIFQQEIQSLSAEVASLQSMLAHMTPSNINTPMPAFGNNGYYPKAAPSSYFALPEQTISWNGTGFAPNEEVTLTGPSGTVVSWRADAYGAFSGAGIVVIPFSYENSTQTFVLAGSQSGYAMSYKIVVGTFYPNITPSTYYVASGQTVSVTATGFAPDETIQWYAGSAPLGTSAADAQGTSSFSFVPQNAGTSFVLKAVGLSSGAQSTRTITMR